MTGQDQKGWFFSYILIHRHLQMRKSYIKSISQSNFSFINPWSALFFKTIKQMQSICCTGLRGRSNIVQLDGKNLDSFLYLKRIAEFNELNPNL